MRTRLVGLLCCMAMAAALAYAQGADEGYQSARVVSFEKVAASEQHPENADRYKISMRLGGTLYMCNASGPASTFIDWTEGKEFPTKLDNKGKTLYVLNRSSVDPNNQTSSVSAFTIDPTTGKLSFLGTGGSPAAGNPYAVGSGPVCMVEDPTNQYVYTSNNIDSTVTGRIIDSNSGELRNLNRGSSFPTVGQPTCLALSGNVN